MNSQDSIPNPLWPNPAPRGPFAISNRISSTKKDSERVSGSNTQFTFDAAGTIFIIPDGESLTDILNRAYWVGRIHALAQVEADAVELARGALEELAREAEARRKSRRLPQDADIDEDCR